MNTAKACSSCGAELSADNESGVCSLCELKRKLESNIKHRLEGAPTVSSPTELRSASASPDNPIEPPAPGTKLQSLGEYELLEVIGEGGMGRVYKARQHLLKRLVAVKVLSPRLAEDRGFIKRFRREAAVAASLNHPNIVQVHTAGESGGVHYFVMEFVEGESAQRRLNREGRMSAVDAITICLRVAYGLDYAWREGQVIHRDIKPDNIFLARDGRTKLGDLGLAKNISEGASSVTMSGHVVGTPHYISPEQARGKKNVDFRSDIYSLGCTLYHMLTGRPPFSGDSMLDVILKHVHDPTPNIAEWIPDCPLGVDRLLARMMAKDPDDRHQSYQELIADLQQIQQGCGANIPSVKPGKPAKRFLGFLTAALSSLNPSELSKRFVSFLMAGFSMLKPSKRWWQQLNRNLPAVLQSDQTTPKPRLSLSVVAGAIFLALLLGGGGGYLLYVQLTTCVVMIATDPPDAEVSVGTMRRWRPSVLEDHQPEVEVWAGARLIGTTPCQERTKPGALAYGLKLDGYNDANIEVQAVAGRTTNVFVKMMPWSGELLGTSRPPGAKVTVAAGGGFKVETNTPFKVHVPVGKLMGGTAQAEVTAQFGNLPPQTKLVMVEKGQRSAVEFVFASGSVHIESQPVGATVLLDGVELGRTPYESRNLVPGKMTYVLRLAGYKTDFVLLDVKADQTIRAKQLLTKSDAEAMADVVFAGGVVEVRAVRADTGQPVDGAEVYGNGKKLGRTPWTNTMVKAGPVEYVVQAEGYVSKLVGGDVLAGRTTRMLAEMEPGRATLELKSDLEGAEAFLNNKLIGKLPLRTSVVAGAYQLEVKCQGREPQIRLVKLEWGKVLQEEFFFEMLRSSCGMELLYVLGVPGTAEGCWVGKYEVTQEEYEKVKGTNPSPDNAKNPRKPVVRVSHKDAVEFCRKLTEKDAGKGVRYALPTEEQWEYLTADARLEDSVTSWGLPQKREQPEVVGSTGKRNKFGLFDTRGNAWEWCDGDSNANKKPLRGAGCESVSDKTLEKKYQFLRLDGAETSSAGFRCVAFPAK